MVSFNLTVDICVVTIQGICQFVGFDHKTEVVSLAISVAPKLVCLSELS